MSLSDRAEDTPGNAVRRRHAPRRSTMRKVQTEAASTPLLVTVFLVLLTVPAAALFNLGPLVLSPLRVFLLVICIGVLMRFLATTRLSAYDYLFFFATVWYGFCHALNYGVGKGVQFGGIYFIQTVGVYAMVQVSIRRPEQIQSAFGVVLWVLVALLPFALLESLTGQRLISDLVGGLFGVSLQIQSDQRLGLFRAATSFAHPILFGLFYCSCFAFFWYSNGPLMLRLLKAGVSAAGVFLSLSAGALLPLMIQIILIAAERFTRGVKRRAQYLFWSLLGLYTFLETFANSGAFGVLVRHLTLNAHTAWYRKAIWEHGIDDVMRNPIFGFVTENWTRPHWLAQSVDNHWLVLLMRAGFPGTIALGLAILLILVRMMRRRDEELPQVHARMRRATLYSLCALCVGAATVAFFDKMEPIFAFYIALGAVFARWEEQASPKTSRRQRQGMRGGGRSGPGAAEDARGAARAAETAAEGTEQAEPAVRGAQGRLSRTSGRPGRRPRLASGPQSPGGGRRP